MNAASLLAMRARSSRAYCPRSHPAWSVTSSGSPRCTSRADASPNSGGSMTSAEPCPAAARACASVAFDVGETSSSESPPSSAAPHLALATA